MNKVGYILKCTIIRQFDAFPAYFSPGTGMEFLMMHFSNIFLYISAIKDASCEYPFLIPISFISHAPKNRSTALLLLLAPASDNNATLHNKRKGEIPLVNGCERMEVTKINS